MATPPTAGEQRSTTGEQRSTASEQRQREQETKAAQQPQLVIVELERPRTPEQVRRLRRGRGPLVRDIDEAIEELVESGTVKAGTQPVVMVVREISPFVWPLNIADYEEDEAEDEEEDEEERRRELRLICC